MNISKESTSRAVKSIGAASLCLSAFTFSNRTEFISKSQAAQNIPVATADDLFTLKDNTSLNQLKLPPISATKSHELTNKIKENKNLLLSIGACIVSLAGYALYGLRSVPQQHRGFFLRTVEKLQGKPEGFYPGNIIALRAWAINHGALTISAVILGLTQGKDFAAAAVPSVIPAISLIGTVAILPAIWKHADRTKLKPIVRSCEYLSYASIALSVYSRFASNVAILGAGAAIAARAFAAVPYVRDFVKEAKNPDPIKGFPPLRSLSLWTAATLLGAATVSFPLTSAAIVPIAYATHNLIVCGIAFTCYEIWKKKIEATKTSKLL